MVVDDSNTIRKSAEMFLTKAGFDVVLVEDGLDALACIEEVNPDLVFIDVLMPNVDGLEAVQIIKRNSKFKNTPIIFLSSKDSEFDKAKGIMVGATAYLTKPFSKEGIVEVVKKYVQEK
jgi:twitching motility two-component system response regulator PilG